MMGKKKLYNKNLLGLLINNSSYLFIDIFLSRSLTFILYILIARYFGNTLFGIYTYITSLLFLFAPIVNLGINSIVQKDLSSKIDDENTIVTTSIFLKTIASFILFIIVFIIILFSGFSEPKYNYFLIIAISTFLFVGPTTVIPSWQNYNLMIKDKVKVSIASLVFEKFLQISAIIFFKSFIFIFISMIVGVLIKTIYSIYFYTIKFDGIISFKFLNHKYALNLIKKSTPLLLSAFLIYVYSRIDQIMIANMLGYEDLSFYSSSAIIFQSIFTMSGIITASLYPILLRETKNKKNDLEYSTFVQFYFDIYTILGFFIAISVFFLSPFILNLFGNEYVEFNHILKLFSITLFFVFCLDGQNKLLVANSFFKNLFYINLLSVLMNIVLNFILIKYYGIFGAAIGTSLSMVFSILIFPFFSRNVRFSIKYVFNSYFFLFRLSKTINYIKNYSIKNI